MLTVTGVTENRQGETSQSGDFFLSAAGSQIPQLAQDERTVNQERLAQCMSLCLVSPDCEICLFAYCTVLDIVWITVQDLDLRPTG